MESQSIPSRPPRRRGKVRRRNLHGHGRTGRIRGHRRASLIGAILQERGGEHLVRIARRQGRVVDLPQKTQVRIELGRTRLGVRRQVGARRHPPDRTRRRLREVASQGRLLRHRIAQGWRCRRAHPPVVQSVEPAALRQEQGRRGSAGVLPPPKALPLCGYEGAHQSLSSGQAGHGKAPYVGMPSHLLARRARVRRPRRGRRPRPTPRVVRPRPVKRAVQDPEVSREGDTVRGIPSPVSSHGERERRRDRARLPRDCVLGPDAQPTNRAREGAEGPYGYVGTWSVGCGVPSHPALAILGRSRWKYSLVSGFVGERKQKIIQ
mmetsp:Transcript_20842/g.50141  ORF Transcript_20842/g.50141 Transcript_20842/m.50141 type:complete len:321 (+) Transcript_20842:631-1593(+)